MAERDFIDAERLESVDLVLCMLELLAASPAPRSLRDIATALNISKPRAHRHLRAMMLNDYVRQERDTDRYEISAKLVALGEMARGGRSFGAAARAAMARLRDATGQAVTASALIAGQVTIVELLQGRTLVQFAIRPGAVMDSEVSAHGLVAAAFGARRVGVPFEAVRANGWAVAPGAIVTGVNALAAPVFGFNDRWVGTIAIVGSIDAIPATPSQTMIERLLAATREVSHQMGYKDKG